VTRRELFFITFDEETARASGIRVGFYNLLLVLLAALTIVSAIQIVGLLLISALLVLPVAAAFQLARSFRQALCGAIGCSVLAVYSRAPAGARAPERRYSYRDLSFVGVGVGVGLGSPGAALHRSIMELSLRQRDRPAAERCDPARPDCSFRFSNDLLTRRELFFITFDEETARASGIRVGFL
jgi:hypothetical protein